MKAFFTILALTHISLALGYGFPAGTLIRTTKALKPIEMITLDDRAEYCEPDSVVDNARVMNAFKVPPQRSTEFKLEGGASFEAASDHLLLVERADHTGWQRADSINAGDKLIGCDTQVKVIEKRNWKNQDNFYGLSASGPSYFNVGPFGIYANNMIQSDYGDLQEDIDKAKTSTAKYAGALLGLFLPELCMMLSKKHTPLSLRLFIDAIGVAIGAGLSHKLYRFIEQQSNPQLDESKIEYLDLLHDKNEDKLPDVGLQRRRPRQLN